MGRLINEDNVISLICSFCDRWDCNYNCQKVQEIRKIPTAKEEMIKPLNKNINCETAYWVKAKGMMPPEHFGHYYCSNCDGWAMRDWLRHKTVLSDYCPHCGYKMVKEKGV